MNDLYTASRLKVWRECNRKEFYRYTLRIATQANAQMEFGTHAHAALEAWYRAWMNGRADIRLASALAVIDALDTFEVDKIRLRAIVAAYHARWSDEPWEVLAVEVEFRYWLGNVQVGGKIDAIIHNLEDGRIYVVEHKTSSADTSMGSPYWDRLCIDTQVSIYIDGAAMLDHEIAGCIYDVLKRPQHEPLAATPEEKREYTVGIGCKKCGGQARPAIQGRGHLIVAFASSVENPACDGCAGTGWKVDKDGQPQSPRLYAKHRTEDESLEAFEERLTNEIADRVDEYLSRGIVVRLTSELPRMRQELLDTIESMRELDKLGLRSPNHDACWRGREMCGFFAACSGRASIDDEHMFPRSAAHPELAAETAATAA